MATSAKAKATKREDPEAYKHPVIRSFANSEPELARGGPVSLRELRALRETFDDERDPRARHARERAQLSEAERRRESVEWEKQRKAKVAEREAKKAARKKAASKESWQSDIKDWPSEGEGKGEQDKGEQGRGDQGRGDQGRGSTMVGKDRPQPMLKPKHERGPDRQAFAQAWLKEQREARMAQYQVERAANDRSPAPERSPPTPFRGPER